MIMFHSQVNSDALNHYFSLDGETSQEYFVTEGSETSANFSVIVMEGIEAATDTSVLYSQLKRWGRGSITTPSGNTIPSYIKAIDSYCSSVYHLRAQNNAGFTLKNAINSVDDPLGVIYSLERAKQHHAASKAIFRYIETNFADFNLAAVNLMLKNVELEELSSLSIAGLVRFTARAKNHLPAWSAVYRKAKVVLTKQGENAERILVGIRE